MPVIKNPAACRKNLRRASFRIFLLVCLFCLPAIAGMAQDTAPLTEITVVSDDNYPPYIFRDHKGRLQGILVDEWRLWGEKTGIRADLRGMDWELAQKAMADGKAQVIDTIFFTEERARKLDYTAPYASIDVHIFFHKDIGGIDDVNSLHGFTVGVKAGDAAIDFLTRHGINTLQEYPSYESIVRAAREDKIKVFCIDGPPALHFLYKLNLDKDYRQTAPLYTGRFHRAVPKGRKDLLTIVEDGFAKISIREREEIEKRWLGAPIAPPRYLPYVFYLAGALAVLGVALLLWNRTLRRKVTQKTAQLREIIDALQKSEEEQRRDREAAERLAGEVEVIAGIGRVIGSSLDIDEVYEQFAAEVRKLIPFDRLAVNVCDADEDTVSIAYVFGADIPGRMRGDSVPLAGTLSEEVLRNRKSQIVNATSADELIARFPAFTPSFQAGILSYMAVPLISRDKAIGSLHLRSKTPNAYSEQDLRLAERIGAQIAEALANARLFTELKEAEKSLRQSEGRFRALFEQAAVGVAEIEMGTGRFLTVNRRLCEMVGRTEEEMLATTFLAITHPEDLHLHEDKTALLKAGKIGHYSLEKRYLRKGGEAVWVNITVSPLWKPGEKPGRNIAVVEDITDRKRMDEGMREMTLRDGLTDLYNRRGFTTLAEQQIRAANRAKRPMRLTFIDCDGLKQINDTLGHEEGDRSLIDTADVLRQTFRESDVIARIGGDEFAVLSIDAAETNPAAFFRRLQLNIDEFNAGGMRPFKLSMSWGTAVYDPEAPLSLDKLMSAADGLMYAQKKAKCPA